MFKLYKNYSGVIFAIDLRTKRAAQVSSHLQ